jgi:hypothetical protein
LVAGGLVGGGQIEHGGKVGTGGGGVKPAGWELNCGLRIADPPSLRYGAASCGLRNGESDGSDGTD